MGRRWRRGLTPVRNPRHDALANLDPYEFERVVADCYRRQGYRVDHCGGKGQYDGGIDLKMYRDGEYVIVQCKRENVYQVTHNVGHELLGVLLTEKADRAILVNTGEFTRYAIETASREPRLELIDGERLREMLPEYARAVPGEPGDLDRDILTVPAAERLPAREPMARLGAHRAPSTADRAWPAVRDRNIGTGSSRAGRRSGEGARAVMAFAVLAGLLAWQCSREQPQSRSWTRASPMTTPVLAAPPGRQTDMHQSGGVPQRAEVRAPEQTAVAPDRAIRSPEESRRRTEEAMRVLAPTTPEFEPRPGSGSRP